METANKIIGFAPEALWITIGVLIAVGVIVKLGMDLVIKSRELRKPKVNDEKSSQEKLHSYHERLTKLEETTTRQDEELKLILRSQMAIIHHMEDGNGINKLKETREDIEEYLISGKIKERKGD
jgi:hypothetical protein